MKLTALAAVAALICLVLAFATTRSNSVRHVLLTPATSAPNAIVQIDVVDAGGSRIEYTLTPTVDITRLDVAFELPPGGELLQHIAPDPGAGASGSPRLGSARLRLPDSLKLAQVGLVATVTVAGDAAAAPRVQTVRGTLIFGAVDDDVPDVATATFPALHAEVARSE